jgi:hypothetical protein
MVQRIRTVTANKLGCRNKSVSRFAHRSRTVQRIRTVTASKLRCRPRNRSGTVSPAIMARLRAPVPDLKVAAAVDHDR